MSGIGKNVKLEAKKGKIIISKASNTREGWSNQIKALTAFNGDPSQEFSDMSPASNDGFAELPWDGPSFEEWQKSHA